MATTENRKLMGLDRAEQVLAKVAQALLTLEPGSPDVAADLCGLLQQLERKLAERRRQLLEEAAARSLEERQQLPAGRMYGVEDQGAYDNEWRLDATLELLGGDPVNGLVVAWQQRLVDVKPRLRDVERYCKTEGLGLLVRTPAQQRVAEEAGDRRSPHLLRTWKSRYTAQPLPQAEGGR